MLQWKDEFNTGIAEIDEQHHRLVDIANQAYKLMENQFITDKFDGIVAVIKELKDYTIYHFDFEEKYMERIKYKKRFSHMIMHGEFISKIDNVNLNEVDQAQDEHISGLLNFICDWLIGHIVHQDKKIAG